MECGMELASFPGRLPLHFLVAHMTFEPPSDKLAEGLVPLLRHLQARWTRLGHGFMQNGGVPEVHGLTAGFLASYC